MSSLHESGLAQRWEITDLASSMLSPAARRVVHRWVADAQFIDNQGEPALLSRVCGDLNAFSILSRVSGSPVSAEQVLDELVGSGLVESGSGGELLLRRTAYAPFQPEREDGGVDFSQVVGLESLKVGRRATDKAIATSLLAIG